MTCAFAPSEYGWRLTDGVQVLVPEGVGVRVSPLAQRLWIGWKSSRLSDCLTSRSGSISPRAGIAPATPTLARSGRCNRYGSRSRRIEQYQRTGHFPTQPQKAVATVLRQEVKELRRANAILKSASAFFAAELDRPQR